jgi:oligoribonuclease NrnB/cAMP/cGMP phosphodiesterase (DHH superfamily)
VTGRDVVMVDFSYKRQVVERMAQTARSIMILDHHKSAAEDLKYYALPDPPPRYWELEVPRTDAEGNPMGAIVGAYFDMDRSGAGIAWDYFHPDTPRPPLLSHVEDRDLWRFDLEYTREIVAALFSYDYEFDTWDALMNGGPTVRTALITEGTAIERKHHKDIKELSNVVTRQMLIGGFKVPVANVPYTMTSDMGHLLCQIPGTPFSGCYWDTPEGRVFSLRSTDGGEDVSKIASLYGGGGHRNASGFRLSFAEAKKMELP